MVLPKFLGKIKLHLNILFLHTEPTMFDYMHPAKKICIVRPSFFYSIRPPKVSNRPVRIPLVFKVQYLSVVLQTSNLDYVKLHLVVAYTLSGITCIFGLGQVKVLGIETFAFIGLRGDLFFTDTLNEW